MLFRKEIILTCAGAAFDAGTAVCIDIFAMPASSALSSAMVITLRVAAAGGVAPGATAGNVVIGAGCEAR